MAVFMFYVGVFYIVFAVLAVIAELIDMFIW